MTLPLLPDDELVAALDAATRRLAELADLGPPDAPVPACPGWSLARLVGHTGRVQRWMAGELAHPGAAPPAERPPEDAAELGAWMRAGARQLLDTIPTTDLDAVVETWAGPRPARFWVRRISHETTLHRRDAEEALDQLTPIPPMVAADGVDEVLDAVAPLRLDYQALDRPGATLHLHATDEGLDPGAGEWLVTIGPGSLDVRREHAKGDVALRARAEDLLAVLWSRRGLDGCEVHGDADLLRRWQDAASF